MARLERTGTAAMVVLPAEGSLFVVRPLPARCCTCSPKLSKGSEVWLG